MKGLVTISWLQQHLKDENVIVLDASQGSSVNALDSSFEGKYIPGSIHFDLKAFSSPTSNLPNTLPEPNHFQSEARKLGINADSQIIVYDDQGVYFSPRVWWMFKVMGHENVAVLDGGLPGWVDQGGIWEPMLDKPHANGNFQARFQESLVCFKEDVLGNISSKSFQVVDARSQGRFDGTEPEPREGLSSGHIPGSSCIPYKQVTDGFYMKKSDEFKAVFDIVTSNSAPLFSCGSGLTACILALAYYLYKGELRPVYDGSWTEWASDPKSPIVKNLPE